MVSVAQHQTRSSFRAPLHHEKTDDHVTAATLMGMKPEARAAALTAMSAEERGAIMTALDEASFASRAGGAWFKPQRQQDAAAALSAMCPEKRREALMGMPESDRKAVEAVLDRDQQRTNIDANGDGMISADEFKQLKQPERFDQTRRAVLTAKEQREVTSMFTLL